MLAGGAGAAPMYATTENPRVGRSIPLLASTHGRAGVHLGHVAGGGHSRDRLLPEDRPPLESPCTFGKQSGKATAKAACLRRLVLRCGSRIRCFSWSPSTWMTLHCAIPGALPRFT